MDKKLVIIIVGVILLSANCIARRGRGRGRTKSRVCKFEKQKLK